MTEERDDGGGATPYGAQTARNTSGAWLADHKPLDVDVDGLVDYAGNMVRIKDNLSGRTGNLDLLGQLPCSAWDGPVLPEAAYARGIVLGNYAELRRYLGYLGIALNNIGMAAQTVADAYSSTDGWSAASLDAVRYAFGDRSAPRPAGLPPMVSGKTWWDHYFEQGARTGTDPAAGTENWTDQGQRVNEDGSTSNVATTADGRTMVVTTQAVAGGTLTMTTVTDREGKVLRSHSTRSTSTVTNGVPATRNEQYDGDGRLTGSTTRTAGVDEHGNYTVTEQHRDAAGRVTGSTVESRDADGGRTTTRRDADGTVVREVVVGPDTSGAECAGEPARAAVDQLRAGR